jgi:hypothetical protein
VTLYFSPRTASDGSTKEEAATDTVRGTLTYLSGGAGCSVDTVQSQFTDYRTAVAQQLLRIARAGCKVRVVHDSMSPGIASILARSPNISVKLYHDAEPDNIDGRVVTVHSKPDRQGHLQRHGRADDRLHRFAQPHRDGAAGERRVLRQDREPGCELGIRDQLRDGLGAGQVLSAALLPSGWPTIPAAPGRRALPFRGRRRPRRPRKG